jgi:hypothetical protein
VAGLGGAGISLMLLALPAAASASSTVVPITNFTVTTGPTCAGGTQSPVVQDLQNEIQPLLGQPGTPPAQLPIVSLNPGCSAPAPSELSSVISASNTVSSSPSGSATISSEALGNQILAEQASTAVSLTAAIPLSSPASSVDVSIPYTTSGVTQTPGGEASAVVLVAPAASPIMCADGSFGAMQPYEESGPLLVFPIGATTPAGSGTVNGIQFFCPDGSALVSGVRFTVVVADSVFSSGGQTESTSANLQMHGVTATIDT